ncbi:phosphatidate cytidylyltransferase [Hymenobacter negativus]|uniref:phosphatidate cytidylyltransferase n=1 Tax=Hymenobacter negativus TaxID=2795026 RepID=UPI001AAE2190|nr:phosphatidate cytidylyltransferase [Hymenobacter negativus]
MADSTPPITPVSPDVPAAKAAPSDLRLRLIWGVIGAALLLGSVWFSPWTFGLFFAFVQAVMLWEFYRMMRAGGYAPMAWAGTVSGLLLSMTGTALAFAPQDILWELYMGTNVLGSISTPDPARFFLIQFAGRYALVCLEILLAVVPLLILLQIKVWPQETKPFQNISLTLGGLLYVSIPMSMLNLIALSNNHYDYRHVFALLFLIWSSDIGAYAVGRTFGKHKLAPKISPGKTWEGWAGGFAITLVVGWAIGFMLPDMPLMHRLVAAGVVAVFAPLGDLAESMLKRSVGVKDSGSIMPGHGGLLDRFDAFLLVLPVLALLQLLAE